MFMARELSNEMAADNSSNHTFLIVSKPRFNVDNSGRGYLV